MTIRAAPVAHFTLEGLARLKRCAPLLQMSLQVFVLCLPLGAVWLGALLYRLARWLHGRGRAALPRELTRAAEWLRLSAVTACVVMVVGLVQWDAARDEVKVTQRRAGSLRLSLAANTFRSAVTDSTYVTGGSAFCESREGLNHLDERSSCKPHPPVRSQSRRIDSKPPRPRSV